MPTPAQNYLTPLNRYDSIYWVMADGSVVPIAAECNARLEGKARPASTSTPPRQKGDIRPMTYWEHQWLHVSQHAAGHSVGFAGGTVYYSNGAQVNSPCYLSYPPVPGAWLQSAAEIKALAKLQDQDVDFGVLFAEADETAKTIATTMTRIAREVVAFRKKRPDLWRRVVRNQNGGRRQLSRYVNSPDPDRALKARKGKRKRRTSRVDEIPSQWLALQYGWKPMMSDVLGAMAALDHRARSPKWDRRVEATVSTSSSTVDYFSSGWPFYLAGIAVTNTYTVKGKVILYYKLRNPELALLSTLGLINPAVIVWEKLRYSFVVDWFVPVGPWLNALTADAGYDFVDGCYTHVSKIKRSDVEIVNPTLVGAFSYDKVDIGRMSRRTYSSSPVPGLYFKSPFSTLHVANALALLKVAFAPVTRRL